MGCRKLQLMLSGGACPRKQARRLASRPLFCAAALPPLERRLDGVGLVARQERASAHRADGDRGSDVAIRRRRRGAGPGEDKRERGGPRSGNRLGERTLSLWLLTSRLYFLGLFFDTFSRVMRGAVQSLGTRTFCARALLKIGPAVL